MNNIEKLQNIFQELRKDDEEGHGSAYELQWEDIETIENLIKENKYIHNELNIIQDGLNKYAKIIEEKDKENKELKEKFDVIQRKIYRLEEDNIELLKPRGKDQLNYKYIECPKVEAEWYKSESYIKDNFIPKSKIINLLENEVIDISGFECISARDLQKLLEEGE